MTNNEPNVFTRVAQICDVVLEYEDMAGQFDSIYELSKFMESNETDKAWNLVDPGREFFLASLLTRAFAHIDWYRLAQTVWINAGRELPETD